MDRMRVTTVAISSIVAAVVIAAPVAVAPLAVSSCCSDGPCDESEYVGVEFSCDTIAPATVSLMGPCAATADAESPAAVQVFPNGISFGSAAEGACHFEIALTDGFAFSGDTTFVGHPPSSCGCQPFFRPSSTSRILVDVPSADCVAGAGDGGFDASGGDDADASD